MGTTGCRHPQALSNALAALRTLQPRAFRLSTASTGFCRTAVLNYFFQINKEQSWVFLFKLCCKDSVVPLVLVSNYMYGLPCMTGEVWSTINMCCIIEYRGPRPAAHRHYCKVEPYRGTCLMKSMQGLLKKHRVSCLHNNYSTAKTVACITPVS